MHPRHNSRASRKLFATLPLLDSGTAFFYFESVCFLWVGVREGAQWLVCKMEFIRTGQNRGYHPLTQAGCVCLCCCRRHKMRCWSAARCNMFSYHVCIIRVPEPSLIHCCSLYYLVSSSDAYSCLPFSLSSLCWRGPSWSRPARGPAPAPAAPPPCQATSPATLGYMTASTCISAGQRRWQSPARRAWPSPPNC